MKNNNCREKHFCQKCFCNPCTCNYSSCSDSCDSCDSCDCCDDIADIQTSLESILDFEANISECASNLFSYILPCELDTIDDAQKKINLFSTLLLSYSNRAGSLSKLINSVSCLDDSYIPNPHIEVLEDCYKESCNPSLVRQQQQQQQHPCPANNCYDPCKKTSPIIRIDDLNPPSICENIIYPQHICNGLYFLEKIKIYFSKCKTCKIFEVYLNSKTQKLLYTNAKNSCGISKTYIV
ncbi:MAG: hypothetical protein ACRCWG_15560 [Sarcina sp.]